MLSIQTVLHPTDFSENSRYAFEMACSLAAKYNARLILLHVVDPSAAPTFFERHFNPLEPAESLVSSKLRFSWPEPADPTVCVEHRVAEGETSDEILYVARNLKCDVIVMGTHGRTGLERLLTGSVAEEVLRKAPCPVLAAKTPPPNTRTAEQQALGRPGDTIDVRPLGAELASSKTKTLAKTEQIEIVRLVVQAGMEIAEHKAKGALVVHCLEGRVAFTVFGKTRNLGAGDLLHLPVGEPYAVKGIEDASLLLTVLRPKG